MRPRFPRATFPSEVADFIQEVERLFLDLGRTATADPLSKEYSPAIDVYENDTTVDIVVDLPGIDASALRVAAKGNTILIVGEKVSRAPEPARHFHLVERDFGRFARTVRVGSPCDPAQARAHLNDGELHISLPKIAERRGQTIPIQVNVGI
jgi:HSP20 family protein